MSSNIITVMSLMNIEGIQPRNGKMEVDMDVEPKIGGLKTLQMDGL